MVELVELCDETEVYDDRLKAIDVEGIKLMIVRYEGKYLISSRICTHNVFDLSKGAYGDGYVTCTLHTSTFDLETGEALNPPATENLEVYEAIVKDGKIYIDIDK